MFLKLVMANGATVDVAFTLVKPVATAYSANPASAGGVVQITGTDLDLVKSVTFGEAIAELEKDAVSADGTTLTVKVPMEGKSGKPKLNLANGTSVEAPELTIDEAVFCYAVALPGAEEELKARGASLLCSNWLAALIRISAFVKTPICAAQCWAIPELL